MKKRTYVRPESIVVAMYNRNGVMDGEQGYFADWSHATDDVPFAKGFTFDDETEKKWGFGPEDIRFKDIWGEME